MNKCKTCGKEVKSKYCNVSCQNRDQNKDRFNKISNLRYGLLKEFTVTCNKCHKNFIVKERELTFPSKEKYFCNRSCANSRIQTEENNIKRSIALRKTLHSIPKTKKEITKEKKLSLLYSNNLERKCPRCNSLILYKNFHRLHRANTSKSICKKCRVETQIENGHFRKMGRNSSNIQSKIKRSKNEIYFAELCKEQFQNVKTNESIFNGWDADIILPNEKIAILWNGKWHYKKLTKKHSVEQVQNRDRIKLDEITKMGYHYYVIKDLGGFNPTFVKTEFEKFLIFQKFS